MTVGGNMKVRAQDVILEAHEVGVREKRTGRILVDGVDLELRAGISLGIVGESGSGGSVLFEGRDVLAMPTRELRALRGVGMSLVVQQAMTALDPLARVGSQLTGLFRDRLSLGKSEARELVLDSLAKVGLDERVAKSYPHELSGGMLQRCMIAASLGLGSRLVVADEPTTALDAQSQYEVLLALKGLVAEKGTTLILVSHDLGAVQMMADTVLVLQGGRCVEYGSAERVFNAPEHDYTRYLVRTRKALSAGFGRKP